MSRFTELLGAAAEALLDGRDPFSDHFLDEHKVTLDECHDLSKTIGVIIQGFLASPKDVQNEIRIRGVAKGEIEPEAIEYAISKQRAGKTLNDLLKINQKLT